MVTLILQRSDTVTNMKRTQNNKKQDGHFKKKNINHDPQVESAKAVFNGPKVEYNGPKAKEHDPKDFII